MIGAGNPNLHQNINIQTQVIWTQSEDSLNYPNVNHYFAPKFYIFAGKDPHFPGLNGKIAYDNFNVGPGSFRKGSDFSHPKDIFGFQAGQQGLFKPVEPQKNQNLITMKILNQLIRQVESQSNLEEYGYGYLFRFLTIYPARLVNGKNQQWYFISRLTSNLQYENIRMGDRALAVQDKDSISMSLATLRITKPIFQENYYPSIGFTEESFQWTDSYHYYSGTYPQEQRLSSLDRVDSKPWQDSIQERRHSELEKLMDIHKMCINKQLPLIQYSAQKKAPPTADSALLENKSSQEAPQLDITTDGKQDLEEYGYGFLLRFLTIYPERLPNDKNVPMYFVSRLATNQQYDNVRMGDRALERQGDCVFITCNTLNENPNVFNPINTPEDIEGIWTYIYYSYNVQKFCWIYQICWKRILSSQLKGGPSVTKVVRFIVGGNDQKRYPGFNGLFTRIIFNDQIGLIC